MGFRGNLRSISLADIFQNLSLNQQTGTLHLVSRDRAKNLYFRGGQIVGLSEERRKGLLLGEVLAGRGLASEQQIRAALRRQSTSGGRLGEILVQMGIVTEQQIRDLIRFQVEEDIYDLFTWEDATFEFSEGELPAEREAGLDAEAAGLNIGSLIMEAARRIDEWERIRAIIPSVREVFILDPNMPPPAPSNLTAPERVVHGLVDGTRNVDDIVSESYLPRFEVGQILAHFIEEGWIRSATTEELEVAIQNCRYRGRLGQCVKLYERLLAIGRDTDEIREALAVLAAEIGQNEKAAVHLAVLAERTLTEGNEEAAIDRFQKLIALVPKHVHGREQLARIYEAKHRRREAIDQYLALVRIHTETGRVAEAKAVAGKALEADPENAEALRRLGEIHLGEGDTRAAAETFERLGDLFAEHHKPRAAAECYRRVLRIEPRASEARSKLKRVSMRADERERLNRRRRVAFLTFGLVLACGLGLGAYEFRQQMRFRVALRRALALEQEGDLDRAIAELTPAANGFSFTGIHRDARDHIDRIRQRRDQMRKEAADLLERKREKAAELVAEAERLYAEGKPQEAREKLRSALKLEALTEALRTKAEEFLQKIDAEDAYVAQYLDRERKGFGSLEEEYKAKSELLDRYPHNAVCRGLVLPVELVTDPPGATVERLVGEAWREMGRTPLSTRYPWKEKLAFRFRLRGYEALRQTVSHGDGKAGLRMRLKRVPAWPAFRARAAIEATPVVAGQVVVVGDRAGNLYAVETATGKQRWTHSAAGSGPKAIRGVAGVAEGLAFFSVFRTVHAVRLADGEPAWSRELGGEIRGGAHTAYSRLVDSFCVSAACDDGHLYVLDAKTGNPRQWKRTEPAVRRLQTRPCVLNEHFFAASSDGTLHAFQGLDGKHVRSWSLGPGVRCDPVAAHGRLFVGSEDGRLYCIDPEKERPVWSFPTRGPVRAAAAVTDEHIYVGSTDGKLYALSLKGQLQWPAFDTKSEIAGAPAAAGGRVYVGSRKGVLYALNAADGRLLWSYETDSLISGGVAAAGGFILVGAENGRLYAFDEREGE